jgi:hypothetical protein
MMAQRLAFLLLLAGSVRAQSPEQIPDWAQQGRFRFARLDGGPIEILKTARSAWGAHFNAAEKEVLGNLYSSYSGRMLDLLEQARVNWVWITWSVGYSWKDEELQREQARALIAKLHARNIHVTAYICATSIFWESMFRDEPRSVRWLAIDPAGVPFRYSGGRDPMRFIADVENPEWMAYQKRRIAAAIDAGVDGFFIDNTSSPLWSTNTAMERYIGEIRRFIRDERKSPALLMSNYGLSPERARMNHNMDVVFNEYWREPGVWGAEWDVSNIRRMRYQRGLAPEWKPMISEYSNFHEGNRSSTFLAPRSVRLAIAEAAAFGSAYTWNMEGPFYERLMAGDASALATWNAIGEYHGFLAAHEDLYRGARQVAPVTAFVSDRQRIGFSWNQDETGRLDAFAKAGILYDLRLAEETMIPAAAPVVRIEGGPHVVANLTRAGGKLVLHLLNYDPAPVAKLRIILRDERARGAQLFTPDRATCGLHDLQLDMLDTYTVVLLEPRQ